MAWILTSNDFGFVIEHTLGSLVDTSYDHGAQGGLADDDHTQYILHSLAAAANDFLVASGANTFVKKTLAETGAILEGDIDHDNLVNYVANKHIDHTTITLTAGNGLTGGGTIAANRTFTVVGGKGIAVAADSCYLDVTDTDWLLDDDAMAGNSASHAVTQQSLVAYVAAQLAASALPADPGFDATVLWDDSASSYVSVAPGLGLAITATPDLQVDVTDTNFFLDEDDMVSDSATKVASQQSIKKYVDDEVAGAAGGGWTYLGGADLGGASSWGLAVSTSYVGFRITLVHYQPAANNSPPIIQVASTGTTWLIAGYIGEVQDTAGAASFGTGFLCMREGQWDAGHSGFATIFLNKTLAARDEVVFSGNAWNTGGISTFFIGYCGSDVSAINIKPATATTMTTGAIYIYGHL